MHAIELTRVGIHHEAGRLKRILFEFDHQKIITDRADENGVGTSGEKGLHETIVETE